jgi:hypothetical protein
MNSSSSPASVAFQIGEEFTDHGFSGTPAVVALVLHMALTQSMAQSQHRMQFSIRSIG